MAKFAKSYEFDPSKPPLIDGEEIPWFIDGGGPRVESWDDGDPRGLRHHILWLPVIVAAPLPTPPYGAPDGESLFDKENEETGENS